MKKILLIIFCSLPISFAFAQSSQLDKNKLMDFFQNQQYEEAVNYLSPFAIQDTKNIPILINLGYAQYMNDDAKNAEKTYEQIFALDSNNISANQYLTILKSSGSVEEAIQFAKRLTKLVPNRSSFFKDLAALYQRLGQKDSALLYYQMAYQLSPNSPKNITGLAGMYIQTKQYPSADTLLDKALINDSMNTDFLKLRILSAFESKDFENAINPGEKILQLDETAIGSICKLAISYFNLKKYNDCIRVCEQMVRDSIANETIFYYEAKSWAAFKNYIASNEQYRKCLALAISKTAELYYYNLGTNYEAMKQFKTSLAQYDTAYYLFKNHLMLYNFGRLYENELNNPALAKKYYSKYLATAKPETADEKKAYEYVKSKLRKKEAK